MTWGAEVPHHVWGVRTCRAGSHLVGHAHRCRALNTLFRVYDWFTIYALGLDVKALSIQPTFKSLKPEAKRSDELNTYTVHLIPKTKNVQPAAYSLNSEASGTHA